MKNEKTYNVVYLSSGIVGGEIQIMKIPAKTEKQAINRLFSWINKKCIDKIIKVY